MTEEPGYRERRRRRRITWLLGLAVAAVFVGVSASRIGGDGPCGEPRAAPAEELALLPAGLSFDRIGTITAVSEDGPHVTVLAVTTEPIETAPVLIQDAVVAAGYRPAGMDSEGSREAEVFFTRGLYAAGQASVEPSTCQGRLDVDLVLLDPDAVPTETGTS